LKPALHQEIPGVSCRTLTTNQDKVLGLAAFAMVIIVGAVRASRILHDLAAWYFRIDRNGHHFKSNSEVKGGRICVSWLTSKAKLHLLFDWMARSQFFLIL